MKTRFFALLNSYKYSLMGAAAVGTAYGYYNSYQKHQHSFKNKPLEFFDAYKDLSWEVRNTAYHLLKEDQTTIVQAFGQVGCTKPVYFRYNCEKPTSSMNAYNYNGVYSTFVSVNENDFKNSKDREFDFYAMMGREAVRSVHDDDNKLHQARAAAIAAVTFGLLAVCRAMLVKCPPTINRNPAVAVGLILACLPELSSYFIVDPTKKTLGNTVNAMVAPFNRYQERRADRESAEKLGTATVLADFVSQTRFTWLKRYWFLNYTSPVYMHADNYLEGVSTPQYEKKLEVMRNLEIKVLPNKTREYYLRHLASKSAHTPRLFESKQKGESEEMDLGSVAKMKAGK